MIANIPSHAFGAHGLHELDFFGMPSVRSLRVLNVASLARAANRTLTAWRPWFHDLVRSAELDLSPRLVADGLFCGRHWDSSPFVCNLWAYDVKNPLAWKVFADSSVHSVDAVPGLASVRPLLDGSWLKLKNILTHVHVGELREASFAMRPQRFISNILKPAFHPIDWIELVTHRLRAFSVRHGLDKATFNALDCFDWDSWKAQLVKMSPFVRSHVLRTCLNTWITSFRIPAGKDQLFCLCCGRDGLDSLGHYVQCEVLWKHVRQATGTSNMSTLCRMGITTNK
jgi:hypothetical protein